MQRRLPSRLCTMQSFNVITNDVAPPSSFSGHHGILLRTNVGHRYCTPSLVNKTVHGARIMGTNSSLIAVSVSSDSVSDVIRAVGWHGEGGIPQNISECIRAILVAIISLISASLLAINPSLSRYEDTSSSAHAHNEVIGTSSSSIPIPRTVKLERIRNKQHKTRRIIL